MSLTHRRQENELANYVILFCDSGRNIGYGEHCWTLKTILPAIPVYVIALAASHYNVDMTEAAELVNPDNIVNSAGAWDDPQFVSECWERFGEPGYRTEDGAVVLDRWAVKMTYQYEEDGFSGF